MMFHGVTELKLNHSALDQRNARIGYSCAKERVERSAVLLLRPSGVQHKSEQGNGENYSKHMLHRVVKLAIFNRSPN
jgi:hypothetical protein